VLLGRNPFVVWRHRLKPGRKQFSAALHRLHATRQISSLTIDDRQCTGTAESVLAINQTLSGLRKAARESPFKRDLFLAASFT